VSVDFYLDNKVLIRHPIDASGIKTILQLWSNSQMASKTEKYIPIVTKLNMNGAYFKSRVRPLSRKEDTNFIDVFYCRRGAELCGRCLFVAIAIFVAKHQRG